MCEFTVNFWEERDRVMLTLYHGDREIFTLADEAFVEAIEDGFLHTPRKPRPNESDWLEPALEYAKNAGMVDCN